MSEKLDFNIDKLKKILQKGDFYSRDLKTKEIFLLRESEIDEIRQCFEFESEHDFNKIDKEEKESGVLFCLSIIRDIIENRKYEIIEGILKEDTSSVDSVQEKDK